jgi:glyoxylase-like metal-dependent hydrolase (beta-lactamase superfamily II)
VNINSLATGDYQTNCYIVTIDNKDIIIDPGMDAVSWVVENAINPVAILNTHGHFDHIWSNKELKEYFNIPIYCPNEDCFMLENDPFSKGTPISFADIKVKGDEEFEVEKVKFKFFHFPGHTPGCSAILIQDSLFSGDFIFSNSIGRVDFPFSSSEDMKMSIRKVLLWDKEYTIYPGHGPSTKLSNERQSLKNWLNYI